MSSLKSKWYQFLFILFDPWILLFLIGTVVLFLIKPDKSGGSSETTIVIITVLISISSAILGARISKQWVDISEGSVLKTKGQSAVRSLKLLLNSIISMDRRIKYYFQLNADSSLDIDNLKLVFSDIEERCNLLEEETINSIENWTDIVPDADIKTHIGIISDLKLKLENTLIELEGLKNERDEIKDKTQDEKIKFEKIFLEKEKETVKLREELKKKEVGFGIGVGAQAATLGSYASRLKKLNKSRITGKGFDLLGNEHSGE